MPKGRTQFKYALKSWRYLRLASRENIFYENLKSFGNENIKLQECSVITITFCVRAARALLRPSSLELGGVVIYESEDRRNFSNLS
jgi:hypothetical protein